MKRLLLVLVCFSFTFSLTMLAQDAAPAVDANMAASSSQSAEPQAAPSPKPAEPQERMFFPKDWYWGWAQFDLAPPHNEVDPNMCAANAGMYGGKNSQCSAFARWMISGTVELRPVRPDVAARLHGFLRPDLPVWQECTAVSLHLVVERNWDGVRVGRGI